MGFIATESLSDAELPERTPASESSDYPPSLDEQIDEIMDSFDFCLMRRVMEMLDWRWTTVNEETGEVGCIPTEYDLRTVARRMLREVAGWEDGGKAQRAGFVALKRDNYLSLYFTAEWQEFYP